MTWFVRALFFARCFAGFATLPQASLGAPLRRMTFSRPNTSHRRGLGTGASALTGGFESMRRLGLFGLCSSRVASPVLRRSPKLTLGAPLLRMTFSRPNTSHRRGLGTNAQALTGGRIPLLFPRRLLRVQLEQMRHNLLLVPVEVDPVRRFHRRV